MTRLPYSLDLPTVIDSRCLSRSQGNGSEDLYNGLNYMEAENAADELFIIELQGGYNYIHRMRYATGYHAITCEYGCQ